MSKTRISLLIELLKTFTEKEFITFTKFVGSTYFNEDKKLILLLKKIKRYALKVEKFTEELQLKVYEDTFCDKPLQQKELTKKQYVFLNNKQRKLLRLAEKFIITENVSKNENVKPDFLYNTLIERNQHNLYQRHLKSDTKKLNEESKRGLEYYAAQFKLQETTLNFLINNGQIRQKDNYNELHYYLNINYIVEKLNFYLAQITLKNAYQNKHYQSSLSEISNLLKLAQYAKNPLVKIYLSNINLLETQSEESYKNLLETLNANYSFLPSKILRIFYTNLTNYCSAQIRKGNADYYKNMFDIYKTMHQHKLLTKDNLMGAGLIKNIVTIGCTINEFEWTDQILEQYKKFIHNEIRESVYFYNKGVMAFNKNNYPLAQDWFLKVGTINHVYEIGLRIIMLQCIFEIELDYNDATKQSFESTKQFFKRNAKLSSINKISYLNFITIFIELYKYKHNATKLSLSKITDKMHKMEVVHKKKWLADKIDEIV